MAYTLVRVALQQHNWYAVHMGYTGEEKRQYQRDWHAKRRNDWIESQGGQCSFCGSADRLEIDHIDPAQKTMNIANIWSRKLEVREAELAKCRLLCKACHDDVSNRHPSPHGSINRYGRHKCRCDVCRAGVTERMRAYRARKKNPVHETINH